MNSVDPLATAFLLAETTRGGEPVWAAKWRGADGARVKRRLGAPAWLERNGSGWQPRPGRPKPDFLTERQARRLMATVIRDAEAAAADAARNGSAKPQLTGPTFRDLRDSWLHHLQTVADVKPSTLRNYGFMLPSLAPPTAAAAGPPADASWPPSVTRRLRRSQRPT